MTIHKKIADFKNEFHGLNMAMSGLNKHSGFAFFQIQDFIKDATELLAKHGLVFKISFPSMTICKGECIDTETGEKEEYWCPCAEANIPKATPVQNVGGMMTYVRRYMWSLFLDLVEFDGVDGTSGAPDTETQTDSKKGKSKPDIKTPPKLPTDHEQVKDEVKKEEPAEKPKVDNTANYFIHFMKEVAKTGDTKGVLEWIKTKEFMKDADKLTVAEMKQALARMQAFMPTVKFEI